MNFILIQLLKVIIYSSILRWPSESLCYAGVALGGSENGGAWNVALL